MWTETAASEKLTVFDEYVFHAAISIVTNMACKIACGRQHENLVWQLLLKINCNSKVFITVTVTENITNLNHTGPHMLYAPMMQFW